MTDINFFEYALNANETNDFFRGMGKYFIPSQDYEGHVHGAHMGGCISTFVTASNENSEKFENAFLRFLQDLNPSKEDLNHLLANLSSYFSQKSRGNFSEVNLFSNEHSEEKKLLKKYILIIFKSDFFAEVEEQLIRHATFIERKGNPILQEYIQACGTS